MKSMGFLAWAMVMPIFSACITLDDPSASTGDDALGLPAPAAEPSLEDILSAQPASRDLPVVLVHGYNFWGKNDGNQWATLIEAFASWGWDTIAVWSYYGCDAHALLNANDHGDHAAHLGGPGAHGSGCMVGGHDYDTPIEHLGYHLAWTLYNAFALEGRCVNLIAHSMGGLLTRYALGHVGEPGFPPFLCVRGVVTLGTPHQGHNGGCGVDYQSCTQMAPRSSFLAQLPSAPQGLGGTRWTLMASEGDNVVNAQSALGAQAHAFVNYLGINDINHAIGKNYMHAYWRSGMGAAFKDNDEPFYEADARSAWVNVGDGIGAVASHEAPWPVRWADLTLSTGQAVQPPEFVPYEGEALRLSPQDAAVTEAQGQTATFQGGCRDPEATLLKAQWQLHDGVEWYAEHEDHVQFWDDPWMSTRSYGVSSDFSLRFACIYETGSTAVTQWEVTAAGGGSNGQTFASGKAIAVPAGETSHHAFTLEAGLRVTFEWEVIDFSTLDVGIIARKDLTAFQNGQSVAACGAAGDASYGGETCDPGAGEYALVFRCRNSTFDCDLEYTLYSHR